MSQDVWLSLSSQLAHLLYFQLKRRRAKYENGMIILSVDVDAGSKSLGIINKGSNDSNVNDYMSEFEVGEVEESVVPMLIGFFDELEVPVTFAVRGQLAEVENSLLKDLLKSSVKHDIGAHGYSHRRFTDLSRREAEDELKSIASGMGRFGIKPKSFVFPKNCVAHLDLLENYGYTCYRGKGGFKLDCMSIERNGQLYNVKPSFYLGKVTSPMFPRKMLDIAVSHRLPFHIWLHAWNLERKNEAQRLKKLDRGLGSLLDYAKKKEKEGLLAFETMFSASERARNYRL
jgi:hypothetical protein